MSDQQGNTSDQPGNTSQDPMVIGSQDQDNVSSRDLDNIIAGLMGSQRARPPTVDPAHRPEPPRIPFPHIPNLIPVTPRPNPDEPIQTVTQQKMLDAFNAEGRWGLVCEVYQEAKTRRPTAPSRATWDHLIKDYENGDHYMFQLACMLPDEVIVSLIRNTLPSDYMSNSSKTLVSFVNSSMNPTTSFAGIYLNITTRSGPYRYKHSPNMPVHEKVSGKWLSSNEVAKMLDKVQRYIDNRQKDEGENTAIDNQFLTYLPQTIATSNRKFRGSHGDRIDAWVAEIRRLYCTNIAPADADKFFLRCPSEVGFTIDIPRRLAEHEKNSSTTPIFGLVNAITRQAGTKGGFGFPAPWVVVLWPLWLRDQTLSRVAESFGHVLCSSYWYEGGFNFHEAGYSTIRTSTLGYENTLWGESIKAAGKRIDYMMLDVELKRAAASDAQVDCLLQLQKSIASHDEAQTKANETAKKLEDARLPLQEKESKIRELRHEVEAECQGIQTMTEYIQSDYVAELSRRGDDFNKVMDERGSQVRKTWV